MTIRRLFISICATSLLLGMASTAVMAAKVKPTETAPSTSAPVTTVEPSRSEFFDYSSRVGAMNVDAMHPELVEQLRSRKAGSIKFWESVSWCETNHKWNDGGYFSGGLGMARSVWEGYGGRQFASRPHKATKEEQIIVANRVAFLGFQTKNVFRTLDDKLNNRPFFRPAVGWRSLQKWGRGCANWKTRKPLRDRYTESGMAKWKKDRQAAGIQTDSTPVDGTVSAASFGEANSKSCPQWEKKLKAHSLLPVKQFSYIMWRESRCQEKVISKKNPNGTRDYGLLQINSSWKTVTKKICGGTNMNVLLDAKCNLKVAQYLFNNGGISHWSASSGFGK